MTNADATTVSSVLSGLTALAALRDSLPDMKAFCAAFGIEVPRDWSGLDVVIQLRRRAGLIGDTRGAMQLERALSNAWRLLAAEELAALELAAQGESNSGVEALAIATEVFPAPAVHEAFVESLPKFVEALDLANSPQKRRHIAKILVPLWNKTIDLASSNQLESVFVGAHDLFARGDYFVGFVVAWKSGADVALRYVEALARCLPRDGGPLPLGSEQDQEQLRVDFRRCFSIDDVRSSSGKEILGAMLGAMRSHPCLREWCSWISDESRLNEQTAALWLSDWGHLQVASMHVVAGIPSDLGGSHQDDDTDPMDIDQSPQRDSSFAQLEATA
jgi:hypothetical protein